MFAFDRMEELREERGIIRKFIAKNLGKDDSIWQDWKKRKSTPDEEQLRIVAKCLWTTPEYLTGETDEKEIPRGIDVTEDEMELLNNYRQLTSTDKIRVLERAEALLDSDTYKQDTALSAG